MANTVKPKQEMKTSNYIALMSVITILVILIGGLVTKNLGADFFHNQRVITKKNVAQTTLAADVKSVKTITNQYQALGGVTQTVNDALPNESDLPGMANAIEQMADATGTTLTDVSTTGSGTVTTPGGGAVSTSAGPTALPLSISVSTSYVSLAAFLAALEGSARPIQVSAITLSGSNASLTVSITATTYYQTAVGFKVGEETVK